MKRAILLVVVAALVVVTASVAAPAAFAKKPENEARDALCKNGGFTELGFKNQGQCVSAVNHGFDPTPPPPPPPPPNPAEEECKRQGGFFDPVDGVCVFL